MWNDNCPSFFNFEKASLFSAFRAWEFSGNFLISGNFLQHSVDFQDDLRHFSPFVHIFRKCLKDPFLCLVYVASVTLRRTLHDEYKQNDHRNANDACMHGRALLSFGITSYRSFNEIWYSCCQLALKWARRELYICDFDHTAWVKIKVPLRKTFCTF